MHPVQYRKVLQGQRSGGQDGPACWRQGKEARAAVSEAPEVPRSEGGSLVQRLGEPASGPRSVRDR